VPARFFGSIMEPGAHIRCGVKTLPNIVLVGFMGTGKTTVGRLLAARLGMEFVDADDVIVAREGRAISDIFASSGEPYFRAVERKVVSGLAARRGLVVAAGGGVVLNQANLDDLGRDGFVVCLTAEPATVLSRVQQDTSRPLLAGDDKLSRITALLEKRRPLYDAVPRRVATDSLKPEEIAGRIESQYRTFLSGRGSRGEA